MKTYLFLSVLTGLISFSATSMEQQPEAPIGTLEEVIAAAMVDEEPAYIPEMMSRLRIRLATFVRERPMTLPNQRLALLLTMSHILERTFKLAQKSARNAAGGDDFERGDEVFSTIQASVDSAFFRTLLATRGASIAVSDLPSEQRGSRIDRVFEGAIFDWAIVREALRHADGPDAVGRLAFRVCEWMVLNWLLANADNLIPGTYDAIIDDINDRLQNPFRYREEHTFDWSRWERFRAQYLDGLEDSSEVFLKPWLNTLDNIVFERSIITTELCLQNLGLAFELRWSILRWIAPGFLYRKGQ
jgi:hypothetical protein